MSVRRDPDVILAQWLDDGPESLPSSTRRAILTAVRTTPQARSGLGLPARRPIMSRFVLLAGAAAVVAIAVGLLVLNVPNSPSVAGPLVPSPTPTASPTASAPASADVAPPIDTTSWDMFTSTRYGFTIGHPADWMESPSDQDWVYGTDAPQWLSRAADAFTAPGRTVRVSAWSVAVDPGTSLDAWIETYCNDSNDAPCTYISDRAVRVAIKGPHEQPGRLVAFADDVQAFFLVNGRVYVIAVWRGESALTVGPYGGSTRLLEAFISTTSLRLVDTSTWTPFTSALYGFTISRPPDWIQVPADHPWTMTGDAENWLSSGQDVFLAPGRAIRVSAWSLPLDPGTTAGGWADVERWVQAYCEASGNGPCDGIHDRAVPLCLEQRDCHPGLLVPFADDVQAFFTGGGVGDSMAIVAVWRGDTAAATAQYGGSASLLEGFLSTVNVWPAETGYPESRDAAATFLATGQ